MNNTKIWLNKQFIYIFNLFEKSLYNDAFEDIVL